MWRYMYLSLCLVFFLGQGCSSADKRLKRIEDASLPTDLKKYELKPVEDPAAVASEKGSSTQKVAAKKKAIQKKKKQKKRKFVIPNRRPKKEPIWIGEKFVYEVTYFGVPAGHFTIEALPHKVIDGRKVYHIRGRAKSSRLFEVFYRLNDVVETFVDYEGIFSHRFHLVLDETKQTRNSLEIFDSEKKETFYWNRWNHHQKGYIETKEFKPIPAFPQDSLSILQYVRTIPLSDGQTLAVPLVSEGKSWEVDVSVVRRERVKWPEGRINTIVLKPEMKYQGVLKKKGDSFVWLTDDDRRILVRLEAKVKVGTVVAQLVEVEMGYEPGTEPPALRETKPKED